MTTLVVGATGQVGGGVARRLLGTGAEVRVLVREGSDGSGLVSAGAVAVPGDLKDPGSLKPALQGVRCVVTTANAANRGGDDTVEAVDRDGNLALIDAAVAAGVERFVFVSAQGADPASPVPILAAKGAAERRLRDSGMTWTIVSPDVYMDVWVPIWVLGPIRQGQPVRLVGDSSRRHYFVLAEDVAAFTAAAVGIEQARGAVLLVGGPRPLSWLDVVAAVERVHGRSVETIRIPADRPVEGVPDVVSGLVLGMETYDSTPPMDPATAQTTYGVTLTTLEEYLQAAR